MEKYAVCGKNIRNLSKVHKKFILLNNLIGIRAQKEYNWNVGKTIHKEEQI